MSVSEADLKSQLEDLNWGTETPQAGVPASVSVAPVDAADAGMDTDPLDIDVGVAGVKPHAPRKARKAAASGSTRSQGGVRGPKAQELLDAARNGDTVAANAPARQRRPRNTDPDVLVQAGEGPAVIALFETMWKDVGSRLARGVGRSKASKQDAAIGWYTLLLAMRERDAGK